MARCNKQRYWLQQRGHVFIGIGLLVIVAAQFWTTVPVVTAIALIGRGTLLTLQGCPRTRRQDSLIVLNLAIYSTLVGLAIASQSNAVLQTPNASVSLSMLLDHASAIVLLLGLTCGVFYRLGHSTT